MLKVCVHLIDIWFLCWLGQVGFTQTAKAPNNQLDIPVQDSKVTWSVGFNLDNVN